MRVGEHDFFELGVPPASAPPFGQGQMLPGSSRYAPSAAMFGLGQTLPPGSRVYSMQRDVFGLGQGQTLPPGSRVYSMQRDVFGLGQEDLFGMGQAGAGKDALAIVGVLAGVFVAGILAQISASLGSKLVPYELKVRR